MEGKILVVDHSAVVREMLKGLLSASGFEITLASDGEQAIELAPKVNPDLILMDVDMPKVDGFMAAKVIRTLLSDPLVPIIFLTDKGETIDKQFAFGVGGDDYVVKPFDYGEFLARVKHWIYSRHKSREVQSRVRVETLSQLMITLAHYINNSLASMIVRAQITSPDNPEEVQDFLELFHRQSSRIHTVVETLEELANSQEIDTTEYLSEGEKMFDIGSRLREKIEKLLDNGEEK